MTKKILQFLLISGTFFLLCVNYVSATAITYDFEQITNNGNTALDPGQLTVTVSDEDTRLLANQVLVTIANNGNVDSTVDAVYFDDGTILGIASLIDADDADPYSNFGDSGVDFTQNTVQTVNPNNLPSGNTVGFYATVDFSADADNPAPTWGIDEGESLSIIFNIVEGADVFAALESAGEEGGLWVGLHVISIDSDTEGSVDGSESYVNLDKDGNSHIQSVPEPAAFVLFGIGLLGLARVSRRKK